MEEGNRELMDLRNYETTLDMMEAWRVNLRAGTKPGRGLPTPVRDGNRGLEVRPEGTGTLTALNMNFLFFFLSQVDFLKNNFYLFIFWLRVGPPAAASVGCSPRWPVGLSLLWPLVLEHRLRDSGPY